MGQSIYAKQSTLTNREKHETIAGIWFGCVLATGFCRRSSISNNKLRDNCCTIHFFSQAWDDYDIVQIDAMNDTKEVMDLNIKYKRINKTTYGLTGSVVFSDLLGVEVRSKRPQRKSSILTFF